MTHFPKLRAYITSLLPEQEIDCFKISGLLLIEAPKEADGEAYVKAAAHVQCFVEPLQAALTYGDLWKIHQAEMNINNALDVLDMVCQTAPSGRLQ